MGNLPGSVTIEPAGNALLSAGNSRLQASNTKQKNPFSTIMQLVSAVSTEKNAGAETQTPVNPAESQTPAAANNLFTFFVPVLPTKVPSPVSVTDMPTNGAVTISPINAAANLTANIICNPANTSQLNVGLPKTASLIEPAGAANKLNSMPAATVNAPVPNLEQAVPVLTPNAAILAAVNIPADGNGHDGLVLKPALPTSSLSAPIGVASEQPDTDKHDQTISALGNNASFAETAAQLTANGQIQSPAIFVNPVQADAAQSAILPSDLSSVGIRQNSDFVMDVITRQSPIAVGKNQFTADDAGKPEQKGFKAEESTPEAPMAFPNVLEQTYHPDQAGQADEKVINYLLPKDQYQIKEQIIQHTRVHLGVNNSAMVIKLRPEFLGEVTLKVSVDNGNISASFHADKLEVRNVIEASLPQLKQELTNQGLKIDQINVYSNMQQFFTNHQREQAQQFIPTFGKRRIHQLALVEEDLQPVKPVSDSMLSAIDYRI